MTQVLKYKDCEVVVEGSAESIQTEQTTNDYPGAWKAVWTAGPFIVECYDEDGNDIMLSRLEEKAILKDVDIHKFIQ